MFRHGVNDIGWSCGGDEKMYLDANSLVLDEAVTGSISGASIVARNTMIVDNLTSGGGNTAAWGITNDLIIQSSDLRLKENVQPNPHGPSPERERAAQPTWTGSSLADGHHRI
jgi:hypothetical protein